MGLREDLDRIAARAASYATGAEELSGVVPSRAEPDEQTYLCAFADGDERSWLVLDAEGEPVTSREVVRRTASIVALTELAEENAGGGDLQELRGLGDGHDGATSIPGFRNHRYHLRRSGSRG